MNGLGSSVGVSRVYRMNAIQRVFSLIFSGFSAIVLVAIWSEILSGKRELGLVEVMLPVVFVLAGALFTTRAFRNSILLTSNSIESRSLTGNAVLPFERIKGRRRYLDKGDADSPSIWHLVLESNDDRFPKIDIQEIYKFDDYFYHWFNALPDLDVLDKTKHKTSNFGLV
jgi:hypothetical protein